MAWDELGRMAQEENNRDFEKWIGVYIAVLAVVLALCSMGGGNAAKDATIKNIEATNTWAFFQAKNMRRHVLRLQADELELRLATGSDLTEPGKVAVAGGAIVWACPALSCRPFSRTRKAITRS